jgi:RNA polymerase sigma-70 factor (ECF subfamily)
MTDEEQSFRAVIAGDEQAWTALAQRIRQQWRRLTVGRVGEADADDLLQEVFVRVYTHREELQDLAHLDRFVRQVWNQRVVDHWRRGQVRKESVVQPQPEESASSQPADTDPATEALRGELLGEMDRCALLSPEQKLLLKLRFLDGLTLSEVARVLQQSVPSAQTNYYRALEPLRLHVALSAYRESPADFQEHLSDQQRAALGLLARGLSVKKIARELGMKVPQVQELLAPALKTLCQTATAEWHNFLRPF